jgi:hypothetical protein
VLGERNNAQAATHGVVAHFSKHVYYRRIPPLLRPQSSGLHAVVCAACSGSPPPTTATP